MREEIRKAFSPVHASDDTLEEVLKMIDAKKDAAVGRRRIGRIVLVAALLTVMLTFTAFAADYAVNHREVFFFDTIEALMKKQSEEIPEEYALSCGVPGSAEENADLETPAEYVDRVMEDGLFDQETVISYEEDPDAAQGWERRRVAECQSSYYGDLIVESLASSVYADRVFVEGLIDWDITSLSPKLTPDEGGQVLTLFRSAADGSLIRAQAHMGYTTDDGKRFSLTYEYNVKADYGEEPEYILNSAYDQSEVFVTKDGAECLILGYDGQVWANAAYGHKRVDIYTTGCTAEEVKTILEDLEPMQVFR